jgi:hypothetical protein
MVAVSVRGTFRSSQLEPITKKKEEYTHPQIPSLAGT